VIPARREKTGGRQKGTPNKQPREMRELAQQFGPDAIIKLAELAGLISDAPHADTSAAQISAIKELLDRGYGKSVQPITGDETAPPVQHVVRTIVNSTHTDR